MTPKQQMKLICSKGYKWQIEHKEIVWDALKDFLCRNPSLEEMEILNNDGKGNYGLTLTAQIITILGSYSKA